MGSEMCIRDRLRSAAEGVSKAVSSTLSGHDFRNADAGGRP